MLEILIYVDGVTIKSNPGPAAGTAVLRDRLQQDIATVTKVLKWSTNHESELVGLLAGLEKAIELGAKRVKVYTTNRVLAEQLRGQRRVRASSLRPLIKEIRYVLARLEHYEFFVLKWDGNADIRAIARSALVAPLDVHRGSFAGLPVVPADENLKAEIEAILKLGDLVAYDQLKELKSGTDYLSRMSAAELEKLVPPEVKAAIEENLSPNDTQTFISRVWRWYLRGLPAKLALVKTRIDSGSRCER